MSRVKFRVEIHGELDTEDYPIPADNRLSLQLKEDIQDAIESTISVTINQIKITGAGNRNAAEVRYQD